VEAKEKASIFESFLKLDRRIIYSLVIMAVVFPLLFPLNLPIKVTKEVKGVYDKIESLPEGSNILIAADFDPSTQPELYPMLKAVMEHIIRKHDKLLIAVLNVNGPNLVDRAINELKVKHPEWKSGEDYAFLGFQVGGAIVIMSMGSDISRTFPKDFYGEATSTMPIIRNFNKLKDAKYMVMFEASSLADAWIAYGTQKFNIPLGAGLTAVMAPTYYPYLQAKQVNGIIGGLRGAAEYEKLIVEPGGATSAMDSQSVVHALIFLAILLANIFALIVATQKRRKAQEAK
jgi:hypothetical protein